MSFFDKILKGLGFEGEENLEEPVKTKVVKEKKKKTDKSFNASFDLNKLDEFEEKLKKEEQKQENISEVKQETKQGSSSFDIVNVSTQEEVQAAVDMIKHGHKILINMSQIKGGDLTRSLDFLTGAIYALNLTMQRVDGSVYLIQ